MIRHLMHIRALYLRAKLRAMDERGEQSSVAYGVAYRAMLAADFRAGR